MDSFHTHIAVESEHMLRMNAYELMENLKLAVKSKVPLAERAQLMKKAALSGYKFRNSMFAVLQNPDGRIKTEKRLIADFAARGDIMSLMMISKDVARLDNLTHIAWVRSNLNFFKRLTLMTHKRVVKFWITHHAVADMVISRCNSTRYRFV